MKKIYLLVLTVVVLASCNRIDTLEMGNNALNISVRNGRGTKAVVEGTTLPAGSSIGLFVTDESGKTYDGNTVANVKYTATGEDDTQKWNAASDVLLSATVANVNSYYPYDDSVYDVTAIPVEATSEVQKDWMWGTPVSGLDNKNTSATITMSHALAVVRLNIIKGSFAGNGNIDYVSIESSGAASSAVMNATTGELSDIKGAGYIFESTDEFTLSEDGTKVDFIVVPVGTEAPMDICVIVNGAEMVATTTGVTFETGKIYEYTVSVGVEALLLNQLNITEWVEQNVQEQMFSPFVPVVNYSGNNTNYYTQNPFNIEQYYKDKTLTVKVSTDIGHEVQKATVTGGISTQSVDENGVRTIVITDIVSDVTVKFAGTSYVPWARIQHVDGTLYTAEEWTTAEEAGTVTDADANGVAVRSSYYAACPHVIHPQISQNHTSWSYTAKNYSEAYIEIPGCAITTIKNDAYLDVNGKANTDAILKYCNSGFFETASAAQYCIETVFANGQQGYLPAAGEMYAWICNKDIINSCMTAINGQLLESKGTYDILSSTQYDKETIWCFYKENSWVTIGETDKITGSSKYTRPVTSFSY